MTKKDRPRKVKATLAELEILENYKGTAHWTVVRRIANRYVTNLRRKAFAIPEYHPNFKLEHTDYTGQARGIKHLIKYIEDSGKRKSRLEKK